MRDLGYSVLFVTVGVGLAEGFRLDLGQSHESGSRLPRHHVRVWTYSNDT